MQREPFVIRIVPLGDDRYETRVQSPAGEASSPCDLGELGVWLRAAAQAIPSDGDEWRSGGDFDAALAAVEARRSEETVWSATCIGGALYRAVFTATVRRLFDQSLGQAGAGAGRPDPGVLPVEVRFELADPLEARLATLPWELLYDPDRKIFLAHSEETPVIRYLAFEGRVRRVDLPPVLRVLVVAASPEDQATLDVSKELKILRRWPQANIVVERLERPGRGSLRRALRRGVHVLHFMGHGTFDRGTGEGSIALLDGEGNADWVSGPELAGWLLNSPSLRLVVLNACSTGTDMGPQPFAGVASALVRRGVPAVLAMRRPIPDGHAVDFARTLYGRLAEGRPLDAALSSARHELAIVEPGADHWATPALFVHTHDVFHVPTDVRPLLTRVFSWSGVVGSNIALGAWIHSQGGPSFFLPGVKFTSVHEMTVPVFGILFVGPLLLLTLYSVLLYQRTTPERGIIHRLPVAFSMPIYVNRKIAFWYQGFFLLIFLIVPVASQVHLMRLFWEGEVYTKHSPQTRFSQHWDHWTKPVSPLVILTDDYRFGPRNERNPPRRPEACEGLDVCNATFFPFWQPWLYLLMELGILVLFVSVMWGIWAREPLRWRVLLRRRQISVPEVTP